MTIPDYQTLMLPVLRESAAEEVHIAEVVARLAEKLGLTQEERAQLCPSGGQTTFANRVHWAKSSLGKARLVEFTRRAHFRITNRGREVLDSGQERIDNRFLSRFPEYKVFKDPNPKTDGAAPPAMSASPNDGDGWDASTDDAPPASLTPDEAMRAAHRKLEASLAADLLDRVRIGTPAFFETLVIRLLLAMGYGGSMADLDKALMVVGGSGDGGVDGVIDQDPLGLDRIYVQAKRYAEGNPVGAGAIRDFFGSLDRFKATKGLFVTTSKFSPSARETAEMLSKRIVLVDGSQLARLMIRHGVGCRVEETLTVKKLDEEFFDG